MLSKQSDVKRVESLFSSTRWAQVNWLRRQNYEEGMPENDLSEWEAGIEESNEKWQRELTETQRSVSIHPKL